MKSTMDRVPAWLALMAAAILTFTFTACSDDEDIANKSNLSKIVYIMI